MTHNRREFIKYSSAAMASATFPASSRPEGPWLPGNVPIASPRTAADRLVRESPGPNDSFRKELAAIALDVARSAGATYADVRLTVTREHAMGYMGPINIFDREDKEHGAIGVRALVDGAWGFTASPHWTREEVARLGREAANIGRTNAVANARGNKPRVELDGFSDGVSGEWKTPVQRDPFLVPWSERREVVIAYAELASRMFNANGYGVGNVQYRRQEKTLATTLGAVQSQTLYWIEPMYGVKGQSVHFSSLFQPMSGGWEAYADPYATIRDETPRLLELLAEKERAIPVMPDRYDVLFDGYTMANLLGNIVGIATELDRVLGWEANAGGTSYLTPIEDLLGARAFGSPLLNISADRLRPGGSATVQWDDEGVPAETYPLVQDGMLVDCHTTREFALTLAAWYQKRQRPIRSHGCSSVEHAIGIPMLQPPNIAMLPGTDNTTFADLERGMAKGLVVCNGTVFTDRQKLNGEVNGHMVYEVRNGKRVSMIGNSEVLFRAPEILKNIVAVGGAGSQVHSGLTVTKGQPEQTHRFGVSGVPALIKNVAVTDILRKS